MSAVDDAERRARVTMSWVAEPGDPDACRLVREFSAVELLDRLRAGDLGQPKARDWAERAAAADHDALQRRADEVAAIYICPGDDEWPTQLGDLEFLEGEHGDRRGGSPFGLWVRGSLSDAARPAVSIVGARVATAYGEHVAGDLAATCGTRGFAVVSGGAYGIDAAAHRGALVCDGFTVAVLAGGIDRLYPQGNTQLLTAITRLGLVVSEAAPGCAPSRSRFLVRNRLIACLGRGTVIVEAALRSGSLNTARWARDLGRGVMGVPGPVTSQASAGVHQLLRQPESLLVTDADEVIEHISAAGVGLAPTKSGPRSERDALDNRARQLLDAVPKFVPASTASIAVASGLARQDVSQGLATLVELGLVVGVNGRWCLA